MNEDKNANELSRPAAARASAAESAATPASSPERERRQALLTQLLHVLETGQNPAQVQELIEKINAEALRQMNTLLAPDPSELLAQVPQARNELLDWAEPYRQALDRPDLTIAELISLHSVAVRINCDLARSLDLEKRLLEAKTPQKTRKQLHKPNW